MGNKTCNNCFNEDNELEFKNDIKNLDNGVKMDRDINILQMQNQFNNKDNFSFKNSMQFNKDMSNSKIN